MCHITTTSTMLVRTDGHREQRCAAEMVSLLEPKHDWGGNIDLIDDLTCHTAVKLGTKNKLTNLLQGGSRCLTFNGLPTHKQR